MSPLLADAVSNGVRPLAWLQLLASEFVITVADADVWLGIGQSLLLASLCLLFGIGVARMVGLLKSDAPAGETLGVGLAAGLLILAAWWAAFASGGRSSFVPAAIGIVVAIVLAVIRHLRTPAGHGSGVSAPLGDPGDSSLSRSAAANALFVAALGGAAFIIVVALLYGSTMTLSPRDGVQPIEFLDAAYYSVLGADLAKTGTESIYSPSGFHQLEGLPAQTWYHWGELWLASAVIKLFGTEPLVARHFVVLPVLLLAAAALTGTLVRRMVKATSRRAYLFGFVACLFFAPVPLIPGPYFGSWAVGLIFGITLYGLAAVAVLLAMYSISVLNTRDPTWALACFVGSTVALIFPAHIVIALLSLLGVGTVWGISLARSFASTRRLPPVSPIWRGTMGGIAIVLIGTVGWGLLTGHGIGTSGLSMSVAPFNDSWRHAVAITILGGGAFMTIAIAWFLVRREATIQGGIYAGTAAILVGGAVAWGARLGDFNMFHAFYGGIAVFATPVAACAVWSVWVRLRSTGHTRVAVATLLLCISQVEIGIGTSILRLQAFGPHDYAPVPTEVLAAIRKLPTDAKLAYACGPLEEIAFWDARLLGIDAHTGRRIVPMCFQAEFFGQLTGTEISPHVSSPLFQMAPQRSLYASSSANPSPARVTSFLREHGIDYIYADVAHPNSLVPDATIVATSGDAQVLSIR